MPRSGPAPRRDVAPDSIYKSVLVTQITNKILERGKRTLAERIVYSALEQVEQKTGSDPVATLKRALENVRPELEVRSRRVGGPDGCRGDQEGPQPFILRRFGPRKRGMIMIDEDRKLQSWTH